MKKIFIYAFLTIFFSSCFGFGNNFGDDEIGLISIEKDNFIIKLPINWEEVPEYNVTNPSQGEMVLAYRSQESRDNYYNNIIILKNKNHLNETNVALMNNNINTLNLTMRSFDIIAEDTIEFADNSQGSIVVFRGEYTHQTPSTYYIQTAKSCSEYSYFLTISVGSDIGDYTRYYSIFESFDCK